MPSAIDSLMKPALFSEALPLGRFLPLSGPPPTPAIGRRPHFN